MDAPRSKASTATATPAATIADDLLERFPVSRVRVRVRKPEVTLDAPAEFTAATVERSR